MKKISKYILAAFAALPLLAGCDIAGLGEKDTYKPGEPDVEGCYGVYFPEQEASGSHILDPAEPRSIVVSVKRTRTDGDIVVPVVVTASDQSVFSLGEISFNDGADETSFQIDFPDAEIATQYSLTLQVVDRQYASSYAKNATSIDFSIIIVKWEKFFGPGATEATSKGHFTQVCWEEEYDCDMYYYDTPYPNIRSCKLENGWHGNVATVDAIFYWNTSSNFLFVPVQWMGYYASSAGYNVYSSSAADFYNIYQGWGMVCPSTEYFDWAARWNEANGFSVPKYDGNGGFYLGDWTYFVGDDGVPTGNGYQFGGDQDYFIAAGFDRSDYEIKSIETDYSVDGKTPVYTVVGTTTKAVKYAVVEGELTKTTAAYVVEDIIAGKTGTIVTDLEEDFDKDGNPALSFSLELEPGKTGNYSFVAVTYDDPSCPVPTKEEESSARANDFTVFYHVDKDDDEKLSVKLTVGAEDTPSRYSQYSTSNSFQFFVSGEDITIASIYVTDSETYEANKAAINAFVKAGQPDGEGNTNYVDDDVLALINQDGGFCTIVDGLKALTSYTVVVWATNGSKDIIKTAEYTTTGLPLEKVGTGTFYYSDFWDGDGPYDLDLYLDPNDENSYVIKDWGLNYEPFYFEWDGSGSEVSVLPSVSGWKYSGLDIYAVENDEYFTPSIGNSSYDSATKTFTFKVGYLVPGVGGWSGNIETYVLNVNDNALKAAKAKAANCKKDAGKTVKARRNERFGFNVNNAKAIERIPQTIECKATKGNRMPSLNVKPSCKPTVKSAEIKEVEKF